MVALGWVARTFLSNSQTFWQDNPSILNKRMASDIWEEVDENALDDDANGD